MLAHYAIRHFLHEAACEAGEDPDRLSFTPAVSVVRRRIQNPGASPLRSAARAWNASHGMRSWKSGPSRAVAGASRAGSNGR